MSAKKSLLLRSIIDVNVQNADSLLSTKNFNRLCIIGKARNGRGTPAGLYKNAGEVAAHYGVEAGEYLLARRHFDQFENGEVLIVSSDYNSIYRPPPIKPEPPIEPEPEPDEDFVNEYISVGYEPLDIEYFEPDEPIEVEPEPEPELPEVDTGCRSTAADFNVARIDSLYKYDDISLWVIIEIQGVNYPSRISAIDAYKFISMIKDKGPGFNANQIISALIGDLAVKYPGRIDYMLSHTNFALSSFDFGKRLTGIDFANKDDIKEAIEQTGGRAENFINKTQTIKFKNLSDNELMSKSGVDVEAINLLDVFNKGNDFELKSCMAFDYTPPVPDYDSLCRATSADFNTSRVRALRDAENISIWAVIEIDGVDYTVKFSSMPALDFVDLTEVGGSALTANQLMSTLIGDLLQQHPEQTDYITRHTNYLLSSFDFGKRLSGIDVLNRDDIQESIEYIGGQARNFVNDPVKIRFKRLSQPELNFRADGDIKAFNYLDIFNKGDDFDLKSCMAFDFIDMALPEPPVDPVEPPPVEESTPMIWRTTNNNAGNAQYPYIVDMAHELVVQNTNGTELTVQLYKNGQLILDTTEPYEQSAESVYTTESVNTVTMFIRNDIGADTSQLTAINEYHLDIFADGVVSADFTVKPIGISDPVMNNLDILSFSNEIDEYSFSTAISSGENQADITLPTELPENVISIAGMMKSCPTFNQDISMWDVADVEAMDDFLGDNPVFNQDLSNWCVELITQAPDGWDVYNLPALAASHYPVWGTCPNGEAPIEPEPVDPEPEPVDPDPVDPNVVMTLSNENGPDHDDTPLSMVTISINDGDPVTYKEESERDGTIEDALYDGEDFNTKLFLRYPNDINSLRDNYELLGAMCGINEDGSIVSLEGDRVNVLNEKMLTYFTGPHDITPMLTIMKIHPSPADPSYADVYLDFAGEQNDGTPITIQSNAMITLK